MTINEKRQLSNYITRLVRESVEEVDMPKWHNDIYGIGDEDFDYDEMQDGSDDDEFDDRPSREDIHNDFWEEHGKSQPGMHYGGPDVTTTDYDWFGSPEYKKDSDQEDKQIAGISELRKLAESYARQSVVQILSEGKKKKKRKNKKEKTSSRDKTVVSQLNADGTNAAHYFYKLYGVENGTDAQKAAARSKGYKKAKGKKNDSGVPYKFTSKERNRLGSLLTDRS